MVFSSAIFLFGFLPVTLLVWFLTRKHILLNNIVLTLVSLVFYAWGEPSFVFIMMASIVMNWLFGLWLEKRMKVGKSKKPVIWVMCIFDLGLLCVFKYLTFILSNLKLLLFPSITVPSISLPIGISFFTFQAMSYVIDCSRGKGSVRHDLLGVALYISFFPQLIAGPIVRYSSIAAEIDNRHPNIPEFTEGCRRFMVGFCKKVLLANNVGLLVDTVFGLGSSDLSCLTAWFGALAYILQTFYDFAGYSDMAIGLGLMFGFHFDENFIYPYASRSVGAFFRRWHISLGNWFRDYVYFPLGGSRVKTARHIFNLFVTWTLTGFWHGADWTFILWGSGYAVLLILERYTRLGKFMEKHWVGHIYVILCVTLMSVFMRSDSIPAAGTFFTHMFCLGGARIADTLTGTLLREYGLPMIFAVLFSFPVVPLIKKKLSRFPRVRNAVFAGLLLVLTCLAVTFVAGGGYNPFIYYNF